MIELTFLRVLMLRKQVNQECDVCHYWYLLAKGFKFQEYIYDRCYDLLMMFINLSDITILLDIKVLLAELSKEKP